MNETGTVNRIEFFWDPICPFAWMASLWLRRVAALRDIDVEWRFINLSILNEERDYEAEFPEGYREGHNRGRRMLRVAAAVRNDHGADAMGPLYEAFGRSIWHRVPEPGEDLRSHVGTPEHLCAVLRLRGSTRRMRLLPMIPRSTTSCGLGPRTRWVVPAVTWAHRS